MTCSMLAWTSTIMLIHTVEYEIPDGEIDVGLIALDCSAEVLPGFMPKRRRRLRCNGNEIPEASQAIFTGDHVRRTEPLLHKGATVAGGAESLIVRFPARRCWYSPCHDSRVDFLGKSHDRMHSLDLTGSDISQTRPGDWTDLPNHFHSIGFKVPLCWHLASV